jgi:ankyrin repeat protein
MAAASGGHVDVASLLLGKGANAEARDAEGRTALDLLAPGDEAVRDLLKKVGVCVCVCVCVLCNDQRFA